RKEQLKGEIEKSKKIISTLKLQSDRNYEGYTKGVSWDKYIKIDKQIQQDTKLHERKLRLLEDEYIKIQDVTNLTMELEQDLKPMLDEINFEDYGDDTGLAQH